jgi:D-xylose transport system permease protein
MVKRPGRALGGSNAFATKPSLIPAGLAPLFVALLAVAVGFQSASSSFLTARNLSNLCLQLAAPGILTLAVMLVLLVGEIDLSIGAVSGLCATVMAVTHADFGAPAGPSLAAALLAGLMIGLAQGSLVVLLRAPSFIVTLSGLLVWLGVHHILLGESVGELEIDDPFLAAIASTFLPSWLSLILMVLALMIAFSPLVGSRTRPRLSAANLLVLGRNAVCLLMFAGVVTALELHRGVPFLLVLVLAVAASLTIMTERTPLGVHIFAIGGNAESARRAGINVAGVRIAMFALCSTLAAVAGVVLASRQLAVDATTGGGTLSLDAIAAAVIGGASLFGGRGRAMGVLLGAVLVASVGNGLDLLGLSGNFKSIATGLMLLSAVCLDMVLRRGRGY